MKLILKISALICILLFTNSNLYSYNNTCNKSSADTIYSNTKGEGIVFDIILNYGKEKNHPTFAIWLEDTNGYFIQNLFVTEYIATGIFEYFQLNDSTWVHESGSNYRPAALPYWNHKRIEQSYKNKILPDKINPIPDAYTGATPENNFVLKTKSDQELTSNFRILLEINQTWDWNEYWTNNKYPDNFHYKTSSQPSLIYAVTVDLKSSENEYWLNPIGHGQYAGEDGKLYTNLNTLTTALDIIRSVKVIVGTVVKTK